MWYCCCDIEFAWHSLLYLVFYKAPMLCRVRFTLHQQVVLTHFIYIDIKEKVSLIKALCNYF